MSTEPENRPSGRGSRNIGDTPIDEMTLNEVSDTLEVYHQMGWPKHIEPYPELLQRKKYLQLMKTVRGY